MANMRRIPPKGTSFTLLFSSRFEPHARSGSHIEMHAARAFAVELQRAIHFKEVIVTSIWTVACMAHQSSDVPAPVDSR